MKFSDFLQKKGIKAEDYKTLDLEKAAELHNEYTDAVSAEIQKAISEKVGETELETLKTTLISEIEKQRVSFNATLAEHGIALKKVLQSGSEIKKVNIRSEIKSQLEANKENLKSLKSTKTGGFSMVVKADTLTFANSVTGEIPQAQMIPGVDGIPVRMPLFLASLARRAATSNLIKWVSKVNKLGAAGVTGEGALKNQISFEFATGSTEIKKVTAFIKVSTEMLDDVDFMMSEIESELFTELLLAVEAETFDGDGTGDNLNGVWTDATAFNGGGLTTTEPNIIDVLVAASNQIEIAKQPEPTFAFLNPTVVNQLKLDKVSSTDRNYVERLQVIAGNLLLDNQVRIVKSTLIGVDQFLIGNFGPAGFALLYEKEGINIEIGVENDDFTKNLRTIIAEWRGASLVQTNKKTAFVKGSIATAKALIATT